MGGLISSVASIGSSLLGANAAKDAGKEAGKAAAKDIAYQRETRDLMRADAQPFRMGQLSAYNRAMSMLGLPSIAPYVQNPNQPPPSNSLANLRSGEDVGATAQRPQTNTVPPYQQSVGQAHGGRGSWMKDPGYQFRLNEGLRGIERASSASGSMGSGEFGRRMARYNQGFASNEFSNVFNRVMAGAGMGQANISNAANATLQTGVGMGSAARSSGYAQAAGTMGQANAWRGGINDLAQGGIFQQADNWLSNKFSGGNGTEWSDESSEAAGFKF